MGNFAQGGSLGGGGGFKRKFFFNGFVKFSSSEDTNIYSAVKKFGPRGILRCRGNV